MLLALAALAGAPAAQAAPRGFQVGFFDPVLASPDASERALWLDRARAAGTQVIRLNPAWASIAPTPPAQPTDPADPAYRWAGLDAAVRDASARGLRIVLTLGGAPRWAEGAGRPESADAGSWKPDPSALGAFAQAAAQRYSGTTPDPLSLGAPLPAVRAWQIWNEPNLSTYVAPQWEGGRPFAPARYRAMLNAAYRAIKAVDPANLVVTGGTAPYGDPRPGGRRIMPVRFWRELLCLRGRALSPLPCPEPASFDAFTHHPYGVAGPTRHALNADDAAVPDIGRITRVVRAAVQRRTVVPARPKQAWVTEVSWDSNPPDPDGVPAARHAAWLSQALFVLWRQGVDVVTWFHLRDEPPVPSYAASYQSGVYLLSGAPKLSLRAWIFPLACRRLARGTRVWGRAPAPGPVTVERRAGQDWRPVRRLTVGAGRIFDLRLRSRGSFRARAPAATSLTCH